MKLILTVSIYFSFLVGGGHDLSARTTSFLPKSFNADFSQVIKSSVTGVEKKMKGRIDYRYPGHLWFEATHPDKIIFVSNPKKSWYYIAPWDDEEPGELTISVTNKNSLVKFFDLLKKGMKSNKHYSVSKKDKGMDLVLSKENQKGIGILSAYLEFNGENSFKNISNVVLTKSDKSKVRLLLNKIVINPGFKKGHFVFKAPKNTRVSQ